MTTDLDLLSDLPAHLAERATLHTARPPGSGAFVLVWVRTAVRGWESPLLDVALALGQALDRPVFVYHALSERYPRANDRLHTFALEGARDLAGQLAARGIGTAFHLERPGHRGPHLKALAAEAAAVVVEDAPVHPFPAWTDAVAQAAAGPVVAVDAACVVPGPLVPKAHTRAFRFRDAIGPLLDERVDRVWQDVTPAHDPFVPPLPFEPVDWEAASLPELVAACAIDHAIGPVPHTRGGSTVGYARWTTFRDAHLTGYARRRNDPLADGGVSRMSAYLHWGMVAPTRLAREASAVGGRGADKFLDELVVWRELAWSFCRHRPDHEQVSALPEWARATLDRHRGDPRPVLDRETLAHARTGDALWDAAQRSLLVHGELHNNVRMTWGKALVGWTADAAQALDALVDLNHRYALDGRDPASYGGLLWCLGQFDRPFDPEKPVTGRLRERTTALHARRLDVDAYAARTGAPAILRPPSVVVVGAGLAGAACARTLADHGLEVTVVEALPRVGGRIGSVEVAGVRVDAGAQHLTFRDPTLAWRVRAWADAGRLARWAGPFGRWVDGAFEPAEVAPRWVGVPRMAALVAHLLRGLDVQLGWPVERVERGDPADPWTLHRGAAGGTEGAWERTADVILDATPGGLDGTPPPGAKPGVAVVVAFDDAAAAGVAAAHPWAEVRTPDPLLERVVRDASRPGRPAGERWVVHPAPGTAPTDDEVVDALRATFDLPAPIDVARRPWSVVVADAVPVRWDPTTGRGACSAAARGEAALLAGIALAGRVLGRPHAPTGGGGGIG